MKRVLICVSLVGFAACGVYKPYTRPEVRTDNLFGAGLAAADTVSLADLGWRELFADR